MSKSFAEWREMQGRSNDRPGAQGVVKGYGNAVGQLAGMPEGDFCAAISSPPYQTGGHHDHQMDAWNTNGRGQSGHIGGYADESPGQLQGGGDTFWTAARAIVAQTYQVLRPDAVAIWVTKAFVRNKERVDFPGQWLQLCQSCGFEPLEWIRAWLVEDNGTQRGLFGDDERLVKERKSFFRRLAEKKGSPSIDYEVVIIVRKGGEKE
jgi:hypothetical protein